MLVPTRKDLESAAVDRFTRLDHLREDMALRIDAGSSACAPWVIQAPPSIAVHGVPQAIATFNAHASPDPSRDDAWARSHSIAVDIRDSGSLFLGHLPSLHIPPLTVAKFFLVVFAAAHKSEARTELDLQIPEAQGRLIEVL